MRPCILASDENQAIGYTHLGVAIVLHEGEWIPALPGIQRTIYNVTYHTVYCGISLNTYWIRPLPPEKDLYEHTQQLLARMDQHALRHELQ